MIRRRRRARGLVGRRAHTVIGLMVAAGALAIGIGRVLGRNLPAT